MPGGAMVGAGIGANAPKSKFAGIMMVGFAAFGGMLFGYDTGYISGVQTMNCFLATFGTPTTDLVDHPNGFELSTSRQSLIVSILSAGTFFGALIGSWLADFFGRKLAIIISALVFSVGVAMQTAATEIPLFVVGRVLAGLGVGLVSTLIPMYQSECSPKWIRGAVVSCYQFAITVGLLLAAVVDNATKNRGGYSCYRIPIAIQFVWAFVLAMGMLVLPESPRWYIKRGNDEKAAKSLGRLLSLPSDDPVVELELSDIRANLEAELALGETTWADCFKQGPSKILFRTCTGMALQAWQQLTGINFIFYYGTTFFKNSGISNPFLVTIATNVVDVGMTVVGMYNVEKFGRRSSLLFGAIGMCVCEFIVAIVGVTVSVDNQAGQKCLVAFVCIYIAFFGATWGPIAWVVIGEIFPLPLRAKGIGLSASSNWLWNFGIGYATPYLVNTGPGNAGLQAKVFFIWGACCLGCAIFTYFCIPETKGLSLEQVDLLYQHSTPRTSVAYRKRLIAEDVHFSDVKTGKVHLDPTESIEVEEKV